MIHYRCGQPAQQQGRRMPESNFDRPTLMRRKRVSDFFASSTQQIHSLRASGVMSSQRACTRGEAAIIVRISAGSVCTVPEDTRLMHTVYRLGMAQRTRLKSVTIPSRGIRLVVGWLLPKQQIRVRFSYPAPCHLVPNYVNFANGSQSTNRLLPCISQKMLSCTMYIHIKRHTRRRISHPS